MTAFHAVHFHADAANRFLQRRDHPFRIHHVIILAHAVRVGRLENRRARELRQRDVIGMAVMAVHRKRHHHLRPDAADVRGDLGDDLARICPIHVAVNEVEKTDFLQAESLGRAAQLLFAQLAEHAQAGILLLGAEPAALPARAADQVRLHPLGGILRQRRSHAERFVVGMRKDSQQSQRFGHRGLLQFRQFYSDLKKPGSAI